MAPAGEPGEACMAGGGWTHLCQHQPHVHPDPDYRGRLRPGCRGTASVESKRRGRTLWLDAVDDRGQAALTTRTGRLSVGGNFVRHGDLADGGDTVLAAA